MRTIVKSMLVVALLRGATVASAQTQLPADPMLGAWKLNLEKSQYQTPPPKSAVVTIAPAARGYTLSAETIAADGQLQKMSFTSAFDGVETPVIGSPQIDTVVASNIGVLYKKGGVVITTTTSVVSDDGKTLVVTAKIPIGPGKELTNISVYERQ